MKRKISLAFREYWGKWLIYTIVCSVALALLGAIVSGIMPIMHSLTNIVDSLRAITRNYSEDNLYAALISATFIMVTLVSFLSGNGEDILWENSVRYSLVSPKVINFISITVALVVNTIFSSIAFWSNAAELFVVYFVIDLALLFVMTYKMIGAFFAKETLEARIIRDYHEKFTETEKKDALACIKDKSFHYIDEKELQSLNKNLTFLKNNDEITILIETLDYLSKDNEDLFWSYVKEFKLVKDETVRRICGDLCYRLIKERHNVSIEKEIIKELYGERQIDQDLQSLVDKFSDASFLKEDILQLLWSLLPIAKDPSQNIYSAYWWKALNIDGDIKNKVEEKINKPYSAVMTQFSLPIELLITALENDDSYSVDFILGYIERLKEAFRNRIKEYFIEKDKILFSEIEAAIEKEGIKGDPDYDYLCQRVLNSYTGYIGYISVEFLCERDYEYIKNIIANQSSYVLLTETNVNRLMSICMEKISISR